MNIAVIGTGNIGATLGRAFATAGHSVVFGSRHPESDGAADVAGATVTDVGNAIRQADVVVLAVPAAAMEKLVDEQGAALSGKLVVDAVNNVGGGGPAHSRNLISRAAPGARYARAFNTLGFENFADPHYGDTVADLFFSTSEADRATVETLISAVGLRPVFVGADQEDVVDGVLRLWFALAFGQKRGRTLAFRMLDESDRAAR